MPSKSLRRCSSAIAMKSHRHLHPSHLIKSRSPTPASRGKTPAGELDLRGSVVREGVEIYKTKRASNCRVKNREDVVPPLRKYPVPSMVSANKIPTWRRCELAAQPIMCHNIERTPKDPEDASCPSTELFLPQVNKSTSWGRKRWDRMLHRHRHDCPRPSQNPGSGEATRVSGTLTFEKEPF